MDGHIDTVVETGPDGFHIDTFMQTGSDVVLGWQCSRNGPHEGQC